MNEVLTPGPYSIEESRRRYGPGNVEDCNSNFVAGLYRVWCKAGVRYRKAIMPHSEVNMHMGIAGKPMDFEFLVSERGYTPSVQLYKPGTDEMFSSPITYGEAGVYYAGRSAITPTHEQEPYYFYPNFPTVEPDPEKVADFQERLRII